MTQLFFDGYSEYELEAMKIPTDARGKCLPQLVDYTKCHKKAGVARNLLSDACQDEFARFSRCFQRSANYYSGGHLSVWNKNNPKAFSEENVSPTLNNHLFSPSFINFHR